MTQGKASVKRTQQESWGRKLQRSKWPLRRFYSLWKLGSFHRTQHHRSGFDLTFTGNVRFFNWMKLLMRKKNFNIILPITNPHRFKDFNKKPWCVHLSQVFKKCNYGPVFSEYNYMLFNFQSTLKVVCW